MDESRRIDKWLWCIRIYKTRTLAAEACKGGKVKLNGQNVKPAKDLNIGDELEFRRGVVRHLIEVLDFPKNRLPAKEVWKYYLDKTPETEILKLEDLKYQPLIKRDKGTGRPTKKDRRDLDKL